MGSNTTTDGATVQVRGGQQTGEVVGSNTTTDGATVQVAGESGAAWADERGRWETRCGAPYSMMLHETLGALLYTKWRGEEDPVHGERDHGPDEMAVNARA